MVHGVARLFGTFTNLDQLERATMSYGIGEKVPLARLAIGL